MKIFIIVYILLILKILEKYIVLYFQNNEALNYISFYASYKSYIENLEYDERSGPYMLYEFENYYFRVKVDNDKDFEIEIESEYGKNDYDIDIKAFYSYPTDSELKFVIYPSWTKLYASEIKYGNVWENRKYKFSFGAGVEYIGIHLHANELIFISTIILSYQGFKWSIIGYIFGVILISLIIIFIIILLFQKTLCGRTCCKAFDGCCCLDELCHRCLEKCCCNDENK